MVYEQVVRTYGPYKGQDNRLRIILKFNDGTKKSLSYPKYLMELYLNRYLTNDETIDHIDRNPLNNNIENLRVLSRQEHCRNDVFRNKDVIVTCQYCKKKFTIPGNKLHCRNRADRHQSGYFCSRQCSGKYGAEIQNHKRSLEIVPRIVPEKFSQH